MTDTHVINIGDPDQKPDVLHVEQGRNRSLATLRFIRYADDEPVWEVQVTAPEAAEIVNALVTVFMS